MNICIGVILMMFCLALSQNIGRIETKQIVLFRGNTQTKDNSNFSILFQSAFVQIPRFAASLSSFSFPHSPTLNCRVAAITRSAGFISISTKNIGLFVLSVMYLATDNPSIGIYNPYQILTPTLDRSSSTPAKTFTTPALNIKSEISDTATINSLKLVGFLTGFSMTSQLISNGFAQNSSSITLTTLILNSTHYTISVSLPKENGPIFLSWFECNVIYFDPSQLTTYRVVIGTQTFSSSKNSATLALLPNSTNYQPPQLMLGPSSIIVNGGPQINYVLQYTTNDGKSSIYLAINNKITVTLSVNYIQFAAEVCTFTNRGTCNGNCFISSLPKLIIVVSGQQQCIYCDTSCATCTANGSCVSCPPTRSFNPSSRLCECSKGNVGADDSQQCISCAPCLTCTAPLVCTTCEPSRILNPISSSCDCKPGTYSQNITSCRSCPQHCLACTNATNCIACDLSNYLSEGLCIPQCSVGQKLSIKKCVSINLITLAQTGQLGYDWSYQEKDGQLLIDVVFSQSNALYYYYENGVGYNATNGGMGGITSAYFSDGHQQPIGYPLNDDSFRTGTNEAVNATRAVAGIVQSGLGEYFKTLLNNDVNLLLIANGSTPASTMRSKAIFSNSVTLGQYYGIGESEFFSILYANEMLKNPSNKVYFDDNGVPFGKHNPDSTQIPNPSAADALTRNLVLTIKGQVLPFTATAIDKSRFRLVATPKESYGGEIAQVAVKNRALIRANDTALQTQTVTHPIFFYVCTTLPVIEFCSFSNNLVSVLWGVSKYSMFIGFGWPFAPLMIYLQYFTNINYLDTSIPNNLNCFLTSFVDFRNPSILYNPQRNNFDASIFDYPDIYRQIHLFTIYDRGLDFLKNTFQFLFVPLLSLTLFLLFFILNKILNRYDKNIPLITQYLLPRLPLQIGIYTLVQALPTVFFYFAQLLDTRLNPPNAPTLLYPTFNIVAAYVFFFFTLSFPIFLSAYIYFSNSSPAIEIDSAEQLKTKFLLAIKQKLVLQSGFLQDPTFGAKGFGGYILLISLYYWAMLCGFATAFFAGSLTLQLGVLIAATTAILMVVLLISFQSAAVKALWSISLVLTLIFLFVIAGIVASRNSQTCGLEGWGWFAIILVLIVLTMALTFAAYLFSQTLQNIYRTYCKQKPLLENGKLVQSNEYELDNINAIAKSRNMRSTTQLPHFLREQNQYDENQLGSSDRMRIGANTKSTYITKTNYANTNSKELMSNNNRNLFTFSRDYKNKHYFINEKIKKQYSFQHIFGTYLRQLDGFYIDDKKDLYDKEGNFLGNYDQINNVELKKIYEPTEINYSESLVSKKEHIQMYQNRVKINGINYQQVGRMNEEKLLVRNPQTDEIYQYSQKEDTLKSYISPVDGIPNVYQRDHTKQQEKDVIISNSKVSSEERNNFSFAKEEEKRNNMSKANSSSLKQSISGSNNYQDTSNRKHQSSLSQKKSKMSESSKIYSNTSKQNTNKEDADKSGSLPQSSAQMSYGQDNLKRTNEQLIKIFNQQQRKSKINQSEQLQNNQSAKYQGSQYKDQQISAGKKSSKSYSKSQSKSQHESQPKMYQSSKQGSKDYSRSQSKNEYESENESKDGAKSHSINQSNNESNRKYTNEGKNKSDIAYPNISPYLIPIQRSYDQIESDRSKEQDSHSSNLFQNRYKKQSNLRLKIRDWQNLPRQKIQEQLEADGYKPVRYKNTQFYELGEERDQIVLFNPRKLELPKISIEEYQDQMLRQFDTEVHFNDQYCHLISKAENEVILGDPANQQSYKISLDQFEQIQQANRKEFIDRFYKQRQLWRIYSNSQQNNKKKHSAFSKKQSEVSEAQLPSASKKSDIYNGRFVQEQYQKERNEQFQQPNNVVSFLNEESSLRKSGEQEQQSQYYKQSQIRQQNIQSRTPRKNEAQNPSDSPLQSPLQSPLESHTQLGSQKTSDYISSLSSNTKNQLKEEQKYSPLANENNSSGFRRKMQGPHFSQRTGQQITDSIQSSNFGRSSSSGLPSSNSSGSQRASKPSNVLFDQKIIAIEQQSVSEYASRQNSLKESGRSIRSGKRKSQEEKEGPRRLSKISIKEKSEIQQNDEEENKWMKDESSEVQESETNELDWSKIIQEGVQYEFHVIDRSDVIESGQYQQSKIIKVVQVGYLEAEATYIELLKQFPQYAIYMIKGKHTQKEIIYQMPVD